MSRSPTYPSIHHRKFPSHRLPVLALILTVVLLARPGMAQNESTHDVRDENQQLRGQVADLQRELEAARQRIADLEKQNEDLRKRMAGMVPASGPSTAPPPPPVSIDESVPFASPRALLAAVIKSHDQAMRDLQRGREGHHERGNYMRLLEKWAGGARREFAGPIVWTVRVVDQERDLRTARNVELQPIDPKTGALLGDTFTVSLDKIQSDRLRMVYDQRVGEDDEIGLLVLRGYIEAIITINPERELRGAFDMPKYVGPYVEYDSRLTVRSLMPVKEAQPEREAGKAKPEPGPAAPPSGNGPEPAKP